MAHGFTLFGLGRLWHDMLAWDLEGYTQPHIILLTNKMIKIWEMFLESYPSICLQLWIILSNYGLSDKSLAQNAIIWSMSASILSITFTVFRILYFDHRARRRNADELKRFADKHIQEFGFENNDIVKAMIMLEMKPFSGDHDPQFIDDIVNAILNGELPLDQLKNDDNIHNIYNHDRRPSLIIAGDQKVAESIETDLIVRNSSHSHSPNNSIHDYSGDMNDNLNIENDPDKYSVDKPRIMSKVHSNSSFQNIQNINLPPFQNQWCG